MKNGHLFWRSVCVAIALVFSQGFAFGQQKSLQEAMVGTWAYTSVVDVYEDGKRISPWGATRGSMMFDNTGRMQSILIGDVQPAMTGSDPRKADAFIMAYFGTYSVNEGAKSVVTKIEAASNSARTGAQFTSSIEMVGDTMIIIGGQRKDQNGTFAPRTELRRVK